MQLRINGESHHVDHNLNLQHLLEKLGYEPKSIAVAINGKFVPRHQYATWPLQDQQELEVVSPMQGG